ncbi:MAG: hypothetical protein ACREN5_02010, partial [Gemmatimonadales bacterium]
LMAVAATVGAGMFGLLLPRLRWIDPQAGFDILGVLTLFFNFPNLVILGGFIAFSGVAIYAWVRAWLAGRA